MTKLRTLMTRIRRDEEGATAIEYGLLAALIAVAIIVMAGFLGATLDATFETVATELNTAVTDAGGNAVAPPQ
jgi:pilus assembly protein Flp/PilA